MLCSFSTLVDTISAFGVNGKDLCVLSIRIIFIPPFKLRTRRLNALEVLGITASVKIHRWTNKKITNLALVNDDCFNFYFVISYIK